MITNTKQRGVETGGVVIEAQQYGIDTENFQHITQVLRDMYSRPYEAVAREYVANAVDAHVEAKCTGTPIAVTLPTTEAGYFDPDSAYEFIVRDQGLGLNIKDTKRLLFGYGASGEHKRMSNDQIGGFGVGCKCGFSVTDQFTYRIFHGGVVRVWRCYLDENDMGQADMLSESPTKEHTGIEISIPIKGADASKLVTAAKSLFTYLPVPVQITHGSEVTTANERDISIRYKGCLQTEMNDQPFALDWRVLKQDRNGRRSRNQTANKPKCIVGGYAYELDLSQLPKLPAESKLYADLEIELPVGYVPLAPNRESIKYTRRTIGILEQTVNAVIGDLIKQTKSSATTALAQYRIRRQLDGFNGVLPYPKGSDENGFDLSGIPYESCTPATMHLSTSEQIDKISYARNKRLDANVGLDKQDVYGTAGTHRPRVWMSSLTPLEYEFIVLVPKTEGRGQAKALDVAARTLTKYTHSIWDSLNIGWVSASTGLYRNTYDHSLLKISATVILAKDGELDDARKKLNDLTFVKDGGLLLLEAGPEFDEPIEDIDIPEPKNPAPSGCEHLPVVRLRAENEKHAQQSIQYRSTRAYMRAAPEKVVAHSRKLVSLKPWVQGQSRYVNKQSDAWEPCKAKDVDGGVYLPIDRYVISEADLSYTGNKNAGTRARDWCRVWLGKSGNTLTPDVIYGVRRKDQAGIKKDPDFIPLHKHIRTKLTELRKDGTLTDERLAWYLMTEWTTLVFAGCSGKSTLESMKDIADTILAHKAKLKGTDLLKRTKAIMAKWNAKQPVDEEGEAYSLIGDYLGSRGCLKHACLGEPIVDDKVFDLSGNTPESEMLKRAFSGEDCHLRAPNKGDKESSSNPIQQWYNFIHETYPLLIVYAQAVISGAGVSSKQTYGVDFSHYIPYIKSIG